MSDAIKGKQGSSQYQKLIHSLTSVIGCGLEIKGELSISNGSTCKKKIEFTISEKNIRDLKAICTGMASVLYNQNKDKCEELVSSIQKIVKEEKYENEILESSELQKQFANAIADNDFMKNFVNVYNQHKKRKIDQ